MLTFSYADIFLRDINTATTDNKAIPAMIGTGSLSLVLGELAAGTSVASATSVVLSATCVASPDLTNVHL